LKLVHPGSEEQCVFQAPLAEDISELIQTLKLAMADG
jgi:hypothetical protein